MTDRAPEPDSGPAPAPFAWPPRRAASGSAPDVAPAAAPASPPTFLPAAGRSAWRRIEDAWLDPIALPLADRAESAGWAPDDLDAYCHRCGRTTEPSEVEAGGCPHCRGSPRPWSRLVRVGEYAPPLSAWVQEVKFSAFRPLGGELGLALGEALARAIRTAQVEGELPRKLDVILVPVPTSFRRRLSRGIDHARTIASAACKPVGARLAAVLRRAHRPSQLTVPASERRRNVSGSMGPMLGRALLAGLGFGQPRARQLGLQSRLIVVIDDVTTTGATLREACRAVRSTFGRGSLKPWAAVVAVTPERPREGG